ncbi:hypothetical protein EON63_12650 [archaeon]|nr:MAG: hypothetical protein EON63_12650 [archaeon]
MHQIFITPPLPLSIPFDHIHTHIGFDNKGVESFWTVTGDNVSSMCLYDPNASPNPTANPTASSRYSIDTHYTRYIIYTTYHTPYIIHHKSHIIHASYTIYHTPYTTPYIMHNTP